MPFLFIDYDQGAGGERFCAGLAMSDQCESLTNIQYGTRTKVQDVFDQEFLKPVPITVKDVTPHDTLYTIVPCHRNTRIAHSLLGDIKSIRIRMPDDSLLFQKIKDHQINKVWMSKEPTPEYFVGLLKVMQTQQFDTFTQRPINKDLFRKVKFGMTNVEILLTVLGDDPTDDNIEQYLNAIRNTRWEEPGYPYTLTIRYEDLVYNVDHVKQQLKTVLQIETSGTWIDSYGNDFK